MCKSVDIASLYHPDVCVVYLHKRLDDSDYDIADHLVHIKIKHLKNTQPSFSIFLPYKRGLQAPVPASHFNKPLD